MANWGRRVNLLTWIALVFALLSWVIGLSGLAALSKIYQDPSNAEEVMSVQIVVTQVVTDLIERLRPSEKGSGMRPGVLELFLRDGRQTFPHFNQLTLIIICDTILVINCSCPRCTANTTLTHSLTHRGPAPSTSRGGRVLFELVYEKMLLKSLHLCKRKTERAVLGTVFSISWSFYSLGMKCNTARTGLLDSSLEAMY